MKILYLVTKSVWGGAQKYVYDLACHAPERAEVLVAAGGDGVLFERLEEAGIRSVKLPYLGRDISIWKEAISLWQLFVMIIRERPDVLHVNSAKGGGLGAFVGRLLFVKRVVFTAHGWSFKETYKPWYWRGLSYFFSWLTCVFAHKVICITKEDLASGKRMWFVGYKMELIHHGISEISFLPRDEARAKLGGGDGVWIGTISELHKNKGLDFALEAIADIKDKHPFNFIIIGSGEEHEHLERMIVTLGLRERVKILKLDPPASKYLLAFDIFSLTSRKEGLPYTLLEAGQAKLAVIASEVNGIPDIVGDHGVLTKPGDLRALGRAYSELVSDPNMRKSLGNKLSDKVQREFSLNKMLEATHRLYLR